MYCKECGAELREGQKFCKVCGTKIEVPRKKEPETKTVPETIATVTKEETFDLILINANSDDIETIKLIREVTGAGLSGAVKCVENVPSVILRDITLEEAETLKNRFLQLQAETKIEAHVHEDKGKEEASQEKNSAQEYLFFNQYSGRARLKRFVEYADKIIAVGTGLFLLYFIYAQIELDEGYKISIYMIRFFISFGLPLVLLAATAHMKNLLAYRKDNLKETESPKKILFLECSAFICTVMAMAPFIFASDMTKSGWVMRIAFGGFLDLLWIFKWSIFFILAETVLVWYTSKLIQTDDAEEK